MKQHLLPRFDEQYRQWYTREAPVYDGARFGQPHGQLFDLKQQERIRQLIGSFLGQCVLDVATGTGRIAVDLARHGVQVTALDLTRAMLKEAQQRADRTNAQHILFVEGNSGILPFNEAQFDAVIAIRFLHLLPTELHPPLVQEMWRVLRPCGVLLIEYNSALAGGGLVWLREVYRRVWRKNKPRHYVWPHQLQRVIMPGAHVTIHGFSIFGGRILRRLAPSLAALFEHKTCEGRASFLANHVFLRMEKPATQQHVSKTR